MSERVPCPNPHCRGGLIAGQGDVHPCPDCARICTACPRAEPWVESAYALAYEEWRIRAWAWLWAHGVLTTHAPYPPVRVGVMPAGAFAAHYYDLLRSVPPPRQPERPVCEVCHGLKMVGDGTVPRSS